MVDVVTAVVRCDDACWKDIGAIDGGKTCMGWYDAEECCGGCNVIAGSTAMFGEMEEGLQERRCAGSCCCCADYCVGICGSHPWCTHCCSHHPSFCRETSI